MTKKEKEMLGRSLPKWPQMLVTGKPVSPRRASEIIRRTDQFFQYPEYAGNDREHRERLIKLFKIPTRLPSEEFTFRNIQAFDKKRDRWLKRWGYVSTEYVTNSWIASAFIGGPHGWCHPNGEIGFVDNVGKWPSVGDVLADWTRLVKEFPFLKVGITLMNGESCEPGISSIVSIMVKNGTARLVDPEEVDVHKGHPEAYRTNAGVTDEMATMEHLLYRRECAISYDQFEAWAKAMVKHGKV